MLLRKQLNTEAKTSDNPHRNPDEVLEKISEVLAIPAKVRDQAHAILKKYVNQLSVSYPTEAVAGACIYAAARDAKAELDMWNVAYAILKMRRDQFKTAFEIKTLIQKCYKLIHG